MYIDDRHNGQLQIPLDKGVYVDVPTLDERRFAAAKSALFLVAYYLIQLGYFLGLAKSVLSPRIMGCPLPRIFVRFVSAGVSPYSREEG